MSQTAKLNLPLIQPAQAQKHLTHNEAIARLDAIVQLSLVDIDVETPPDNANEGAAYGLGSAPQGLWNGQAHTIALRIGNGWEFVTPEDGWSAWVVQSEEFVIRQDGVWTPYLPEMQNIPLVGINSSASEANRLTVSSPSTLLTHAGSNHRLSVNKASATDTASLVFQSGFTGHAEIGLSGDTALSFKVSPDGVSWTTALRADAQAGVVTIDMPLEGQGIQQSPTDLTPGRLMRADYGYSAGNVIGPVTLNGTTPTGGVIERGQTTNGEFVRWADGTQICWNDVDLSFDSAGYLVHSWAFPQPFSNSAPVITANLRDATTTSITPGDLSGPFAMTQSATATTLAEIRLYARSGVSGFQGSDLAPAQVVAIGRWA